MLLKFILPGLCLLGSARAQTSPALGEPAAASSSRYAGEAAVMEHLSTVYRYAADGTGSKQLTLSIRVQTEAAVRQLGVITVPFASAEEHVEFDYVRVRRPDGTVVETPASEAQEISSDVTRQAPLFSDLKEKQLPVRSLRVGDTLQYQVRVVRTVAEAPNEIWGAHNQLTGLVVLEETVELRLPAAKTIIVWSPTSKPVIQEENGDRIYRWTASHLEPTAGPEADARKESDKTKTLTPAESADLQFGKFPLVAWTTFKSWDAVGAWYRSLEADRTVADRDIKAKVAELIAGKTTSEEKIRAIYSYVATSVRYIGVDLGVGRYQPHLASEVFRNQYGDCKDKHTLLAAMLLQAGFEPSAVLVGIGIRFNPDVPSPGSFNHAITQVASPAGPDGKPIWLDSTQEVAPYRALLPVVRDKDVLVVPPSGLSRIEKTPATLPYPSIEHFESIGTLTADGISDSHIVLTLRGDDELVYRTVVHQLSPGQYGDFMQGVSQNFGFAGTTSHVEISRPESTADPMRIAYDYKREKPGDWDNLRIYPQWLPINIAAPDEKNPPKIPIELGLPRTESASSAMKLPEGWGATLPADIHVKTPFANFDKTYRLEKGILYAERNFDVLKLEIPAADWKIFNKFTDDILLNNEPTVQLSNPVKGTSQAASSAYSASNEEAARLQQQANTDIYARRFDDALSDLDQAKKINDKQPFLWSTYGFRSYMQGNSAEALDFYNKELTLHPDETYIYGIMADAQIALGKRKDAVASLRLRLAGGAPDERLSLELARLLLEDEDAAAAIDVLKGALANWPDHPSVQALMGTALIKSGKVADGTALLKGFVEKSEDARALNDSAYQLANANVALDVAEAAARKALDKLAQQTQTLTIDSSQIQWQPASRQVFATWDTLGWVLFREHSLPEAESYINAAWMLSRQPETGLHLGQVQETKGDLNGALTTYMTAASGTVFSPESGPGPLPAPLAKNLADRIAALRAKGAKENPAPKANGSVRMGNGSGGQMSMPEAVPLGPSGDSVGGGQFTVILDAKGVVAAQSGSGASRLKDGEAIMHRLDTKPWWPGNSPVRVMRQGLLLCQPDGCSFTYFPY